MQTKFIIAVLGLDVPDSSACVLLCLWATWIVFLYLITFSVFLFFMNLHSLPWDPCKHLGPQHPVASSA